jgi:ADP-ribose pyrophosphatase
VKILKTVPITESRWIRQKRIIYENDSGQVLEWDYIEREQTRQVVLIMPRFKPSGDLLFVRQYRIIFNRYVIGFPAGILEDEDIETCALRELREETGYTGKILRISPPLTSNSALVKELSYCVVVEVADDAIPEDQDLEPSEKIETFRVKKDGVEDFFNAATARGDIIGGGLWYLLMAEKYR